MNEEYKSCGLAIASMTLGIVSFIFSCWVIFISIPGSITSLCLGIAALKKVKAGTGSGKGMAIAGIVTSVLCMILLLLYGLYVLLLYKFIWDLGDLNIY